MGRFFSPPRLYWSAKPAARAELLRHNIRCAFLAGVKMVFLADIHAEPRFTDDMLEALCARVAALEPEVLLLGGDLAEDQPSLDRLLRALETVRPPRGIFACRGNNDTSRRGFLRAVEGRVRVLVNEAVALEFPGGALVVGGVDDWKRGRPSARGLFPAGENAFRLLLSHYPVAQDYGDSPKADLQLSGHTHGGQWNVLGLTPFSFLFEHGSHRWISGECVLGGVPTIVSNGLGMSRLPLRVGAPPQIHLVQFYK